MTNSPIEFADDRALIIEKAAVDLYRMPPSVPWEDATHRVPAIEVIVLELTVDGRPAYGFSYTVGVGGTAVRALLEDYCLSQLVGRDARYVVGTWDSMYHHLHRLGMGAVTTLALAAIDVALWEVRCQASGRPLYLELGGSSRSTPAYTSGIDLHLTPAELAELQIAKRDEGYEWFKVKVGMPRLADDVARVAAAREAIGPDAHLVVDANQAWDLGEAIRRCRALEPFNIDWMEEPMPPEDVGGHATLRGKTAIPIALGESLYTIQSVQDYLSAGAVDIVQADIARVGGLTPWLKIANLSAAWNKPVAPHFLVELSLHALCAVDNGLVLENVRGGALHDLGLTREPIRVVEGAALPARVPGHGVTLELEKNHLRLVPAAGYRFDDIRSHKE